MLFTKMNGLGNDYIFIDSSNVKKSQLDYIYNNIQRLAPKMSNRNFGIGGDGVVVLDHSSKADVKMRIFNADGSEGKMCGNALRCVGMLLFKRFDYQRKEFLVETLSGEKLVQIVDAKNGEFNVLTELGTAKLVDLIDGIEIIDIGNLHAVFYCNSLDETAINKARIIAERYDLNSEAVLISSPSFVQMRVWERGSGETLACGTGAAAVAYSAFKKGLYKETIKIKLKGGILTANCNDDQVSIIGPASLNYIGEIDLDYYGKN